MMFLDISVNTFFFSQLNLLHLKEKYIFSQLSKTKSLIYERKLKDFMNFFLTSICHFLSHIYFKKYKTNCLNGPHYHLDISHRKNCFSSLSHPYRKLALHCPKLIFPLFFIMLHWWRYTLLKCWFILNMLTRDWNKSLQVFLDKDGQPEAIVPISEDSGGINPLKLCGWSLR